MWLRITLNKMIAKITYTHLLILIVSFNLNWSLASNVIVPAEAVKSIDKVNSQIHWENSINSVIYRANKENKLIFFVHILGDMNGYTWSAGNSLRAVTLCQEPLFSLLKNYFVCGYKDITGQDYAGSSGHHGKTGKAVKTSNGAGPRNLQLFVLAKDGTVLTCLPGYWDSQDLLSELKLAYKLNALYNDPKIAKHEKAKEFSKIHLDHIKKHSQAMVNRSHLQHFDAVYEARHNIASSDVIKDRELIDRPTSRFPLEAFKTTDVIMHERMAKRPFKPYVSFDTKDYVAYGKPMYDKNEDNLATDGSSLVGAFAHDPNNQSLQNTVKVYNWKGK